MKHEPAITKANVLPVIRRLTETRIAWGLSVDDIAERIGCAAGTLSKYEGGQNGPSLFMLICWAEVLGFELSLWPKREGI